MDQLEHGSQGAQPTHPETADVTTTPMAEDNKSSVDGSGIAEVRFPPKEEESKEKRAKQFLEDQSAGNDRPKVHDWLNIPAPAAQVMTSQTQASPEASFGQYVTTERPQSSYNEGSANEDQQQVSYSTSDSLASIGDSLIALRGINDPYEANQKPVKPLQPEPADPSFIPKEANKEPLKLELAHLNDRIRNILLDDLSDVAQDKKLDEKYNEALEITNDELDSRRDEKGCDIMNLDDKEENKLDASRDSEPVEKDLVNFWIRMLTPLAPNITEAVVRAVIVILK